MISRTVYGVATIKIAIIYSNNLFQQKFKGRFIWNRENKNQGVFVKHYMYALSGNKVQKAIFSFKVKVKVTRSLTLMSVERVSVEYAC